MTSPDLVCGAMSAFLERVSIEGVGCIQSTSLKLSPLHALIGPNDAGKSTVLRAVRVALELVQTGLGKGRPGFPTQGLSENSKLSVGRGALAYDLAFSQVAQSAVDERLKVDGVDVYGFRRGFHSAGSLIPRYLRDDVGVRARVDLPELRSGRRGLFLPAWVTENAPHLDEDSALTEDARALYSALRVPRLLRLDPDVLRSPSHLLVPGEPLFFRDDRGSGLAAVLDALRDRGDERYRTVAEKLKSKFPTVDLLQLERSLDGAKTVAVKLKNGTTVPAQLMSEGMLYFLAFLAIEQLDEPSFFLIEEPENGLHPSRIGEVMDILREVSKSSQILLATHSPLVVNELAGDEVTVLRRDPEHGTQATLLSETANFEERAKAYATGELWLSYANGIDERALFDGGPRP
jgi:predicted ATPase